MAGAASAGYVSSPSAMTYTSASMSSNMARITLPLPWRGSLRTIAPSPDAISAVRSVELLSYTYTSASGSAALKSRTTLPMVTSSL